MHLRVFCIHHKLSIFCPFKKINTSKSLLLKIIKYIILINELLSPFYSFYSTSSLGEWVQAKVDWRERKKESRKEL